MNSSITIYTDGGARGNPGPAAYGFVVYDEKSEVLFKEGKAIGETTNNIAEYSGVLASLKWLKEQGKKDLIVAFFMDSELVARQMSGIYKVKNENLRSLFHSIKKLEEELNLNTSYSSIPREENTVADSLVNQALDSL